MLDEIRTLIVLTEAGSLQRAAERLFLTPSAVTRQIQRLEASLGAPVLDRRVKPPAITSVGRSVIEQGRPLLRSFETLMSSASGKTEPAGAFRLGLAHGLAVSTIATPIRRMTDRFAEVRPHLVADMTQNLLERVRRGDLHAALMLLPSGDVHSSDLIGRSIAEDEMVIAGPSAILEPAAHRLDMLSGKGWVLNPPGCLVRESFRTALEAAGLPFKVAAEVHNVELQLSLVDAGYGLGLFSRRFLERQLGLRTDRLAFWKEGLSLPVSITFVKAGALGRLEPAASVLQDELRAFFNG
jgi:DNA-binding transcriptional LysR family regulator